MPIKDPIARKQYFRNYHRKRRAAGRVGSTEPTDKPIGRERWRVETARDLLDIIVVQLNALLNDSNVETAIKSRAVAQLCGVAKGIIELTGIESEIDEVEAALKEKQPAKSWKDEAF